MYLGFFSYNLKVFLNKMSVKCIDQNIQYSTMGQELQPTFYHPCTDLNQFYGTNKRTALH